MKKHLIKTVLVAALALSTATACTPAAPTSSTTALPATAVAVTNNNDSVQVTTVAVAATATQPATATAVATPTTVTETLNDKQPAHDVSDTLSENATAIAINLQGATISTDGAGITVNGSTATITAAGAYELSGTLDNGQIVVDTADAAGVELILNNATIHNDNGAAIAVLNAEEVAVVLAEGSINSLSDGTNYLFPDPTSDEPNATLFSKADLTVSGSGSLTVNAAYNDGIASKDGLVIAAGTLNVNAADDGLRGKDYLMIENGTLVINAGGDGLKSDEEEDPTKGYVAIQGGNLTITAEGDGIQAETDVLVTAGEFTLTTGGGSNASLAADASAKAIKGGNSVTIDGGTFTINAADDAVHSNAAVTINGGTFAIQTGDDAIHGDATVTINNGDITIATSYEGVESPVITINGGSVRLNSNDDGINVAGGVDGSGNMRPGGGGRPPRGGAGGAADIDTMSYSGANYLIINGGTVVVNSGGDGLDINGAAEMTGGVVVVNGPTAQMNSALDYDGYFKISGGVLVAAGSAGMAQVPGRISTQNSLLTRFNGTVPAGTLINIADSAGNSLLTFSPGKAYQTLAFSSPDLQTGGSYTLSIGGSSTGTAVDGLYLDGVYTPSGNSATFTVNDVVTQI